MTCSPHDLRDYFFAELDDTAHRQVEAHSKTCIGCREELDRLRLTQASLLTLRDEEIPQRIGFVSDRVYEPSALRRWWRGVWTSAPRLGFASAAMLSAALVVFALSRPVATPPPSQIDTTKIQADFARQLDAAVAKAVAESDARHADTTARLLDAAEKRFAEERRKDIQAVSHSFALLEKQVQFIRRADMRGPQ